MGEHGWGEARPFFFLSADVATQHLPPVLRVWKGMGHDQGVPPHAPTLPYREREPFAFADISHAACHHEHHASHLAKSIGDYPCLHVDGLLCVCTRIPFGAVVLHGLGFT